MGLQSTIKFIFRISNHEKDENKLSSKHPGETIQSSHIGSLDRKPKKHLSGDRAENIDHLNSSLSVSTALISPNEGRNTILHDDWSRNMIPADEQPV